MKVVFLDIDGVMNSNFWNETHQIEISNGELIDEEKAVLLSKIIKETNATVVLHSAWRFWLSDNLQPVRKEAGNLIELFGKYDISIYDKTPDLSDDEIKMSKKFSLIKAKEILTWLGEHKEVETYLVLDDLDLHNDLIAERQMRTDSAVGLTEKDVERAIMMLSGHEDSGAGIFIVKAEINSSEALELMDELSDELQAITGNSGRRSFDDTDMKSPRSIFVIAKENNVAIGCGAFREISDDTAEIKRMFARKKSVGVGGKILAYLEEQAKEFGYSRIVLETRKCNEKAVYFYRKHGYRVIKNYGKYEEMPEAICFEKWVVK